MTEFTVKNRRVNYVKQKKNLELPLKFNSMVSTMTKNDTTYQGTSTSVDEETTMELFILCQQQHPNEYKIGKILSKIKKRLSHDEFCLWISEHSMLSPGCAHNLIRLYRLTQTKPKVIGLRECALYLQGLDR